MYIYVNIDVDKGNKKLKNPTTTITQSLEPTEKSKKKVHLIFMMILDEIYFIKV